MKRERLVKKYLPVQPYDMAGLEKWFSDMAAHGLHLVKADADSARFRPGVPRTGVRYALEVTGPGDIDRERNEDYAQMGWDYVTTLKVSLMVSMYYVYRTENPGAPALHTDPVIQSTTVAKLVRRLRRTLVFLAVLLALFFRNELAALFSDPWSAPRFLLLRTETAALWLAMMVPYGLLTLIPFCRQLWGLGRVRRQLAAGIPLKEETRRRRIPVSVLYDGLLVLVVVCVAISLGLRLNRPRALSGPEEWTFPHVTLEQALAGTGAGPATPESPYDKMLHKDTFRRSFLCPEQYSWNQSGEAVFGGVSQEVFLSVDYYRSLSPEVSRLLFTCLEADYRRSISDYKKQQEGLYLGFAVTLLSDFHEVPAHELDILRLFEYQTDDDPVTFCWLGRKNGQVFRLLCRGIPDPERVLELLAAQLD